MDNTPTVAGQIVAGRWTAGEVPGNCRLGSNALVTGDLAFKRFHCLNDDALVIGAFSTMDGVHFSFGAQAKATIGEHCYFTNAVLLCEVGLQIGNYVVIGWNTTIADTDFHPISPAERMNDAIACSPLGKGMRRAEVSRKPVIIEDDVWIGPNVTILKGVRIGEGAFIEAGSLITRDIPPRARVMGNPAQIVGEVL